MAIDRRTVLAGMAVSAAAGSAVRAQDMPHELFGDEDFLLWPDGPPGPPAVPSDSPTDTRVPTISMFRPARPNGVALLMFQGGGYVRIGRGPGLGRWWADRGYTTFDMLYRLPGGGWSAGPDVTLQDAQRGVRFIRANADRFGIDPNKVGIAGWSSGGHVASSLATRFATEMAPPGSGWTDISPRADFALLGCPVVTMMDPYAHRGSRQQMFGDVRNEEEMARRSAELLVTEFATPCNLVHAADDRVVPPENSMMLFSALRAAEVEAEMHIFAEGGHSLGVGFQPGNPLSAYPGLWLDWLTRRGCGPSQTA